MRLDQIGTSWLDELPSVLWFYRTTPRTATQETPFSLTYGSEAVVPAKFLTSSPRIAAYAVEANEEERRTDLDFSEEKSDAAAARMVLYKNILTSYYNSRVKNFRFIPRDLVLRKNSVSRVEPQNKLSPNWEGPYRVVEISQNGYCKLAYRDTVLVPRTWHAQNLKLYFS
ncbi:uncharacterized protein [Coffea arabica]|uniref:Uncharacterized protein n=1 Tax=Coffea arabica TaxID=13443 RepID=A0ABM4X7C9_COFAR